jgi:hypothetical protein
LLDRVTQEFLAAAGLVVDGAFVDMARRHGNAPQWHHVLFQAAELGSWQQVRDAIKTLLSLGQPHATLLAARMLALHGRTAPDLVETAEHALTQALEHGRLIATDRILAEAALSTLRAQVEAAQPKN